MSEALIEAIDTIRDLRRTQIIRAARTLIAEGGLEALTISKLEERVDFSRGVITYHFTNKEEIVEAVLMSATKEIAAGTEARVEAAEPLDRLKVAMRATVEGYLQHREAAQILLSFWGRIASDPRAQKINANLYATYRREVSKLIDEAVRQKLITKVDTDALAATMVGVTLGVVTQAYFDPKNVDPLKTIDLAAEKLVEGLKKRRS